MYIFLSNTNTKNIQSIKYNGTLRRYNWSIQKIRNFMRNLCVAA